MTENRIPRSSENDYTDEMAKVRRDFIKEKTGADLHHTGQYSIDTDVLPGNIENFVGIEYESCCWAIRLIAQKYLNTQLDSFGIPIISDSDALNSGQYSKGIEVQFVFKGLGSAGKSGITQMLESGIRGYRDPFLN